jgi:hypothetical protein
MTGTSSPLSDRDGQWKSATSRCIPGIRVILLQPFVPLLKQTYLSVPTERSLPLGPPASSFSNSDFLSGNHLCNSLVAGSETHTPRYKISDPLRKSQAPEDSSGIFDDVDSLATVRCRGDSVVAI